MRSRTTMALSALGLSVTAGALLVFSGWPPALPATTLLPVTSPKQVPSTVSPMVTVASWNLHSLRRAILAAPVEGGLAAPASRPSRDDLAPATASDIDDRLREVSAALERLSADIVLLQEVDLDSAETGHRDQAAAIAKLADYPHVACAPLLDAPGWLGSGRRGVCVLSRSRILGQKRLIATPGASFESHPGGQEVEIEVGGRRVVVGNYAIGSSAGDGARLASAIFAGWKKQSRPVFAALTHTHQAPPAPKNAPDILVNLDDTRSKTWPSSAPRLRITSFYLHQSVPLVDVRIGFEAGEASLSLPVVVRVDLAPPTARGAVPKNDAGTP